MQVESALFFETPEELYARVFRALKPRTPVPRITVRFRRYANANARIRLNAGELSVYISDLLEGAPAPIQEALASILISKLFRKRPEPATLARYRRYLNRSDMRRVLHLVKQERGRKLFREPKGKVYDLTELFEELNWKYFHGLLGQPRLGWSLRPSRTTLGHFDPSHNAIVLSRLLDSVKAPEIVVKYVMFHEMLHLKFPTEHRGYRRCVHTKDFKEAERVFDGYEEAKKALNRFVDETRLTD
ncbi:MAG TPA: SprT-like domain-containing protein [Bryobacteraceae bacterium]|nr:SprT-like domain-containing protein [Bryobacteraceae bacterium]